MSYSPYECNRKCDWLSCAAGLGLVGHGHCFNGGAWWMQCCPEYISEDDFLTAWENLIPDNEELTDI